MEHHQHHQEEPYHHQQQQSYHHHHHYHHQQIDELAPFLLPIGQPPPPPPPIDYQHHYHPPTSLTTSNTINPYFIPTENDLISSIEPLPSTSQDPNGFHDQELVQIQDPNHFSINLDQSGGSSSELQLIESMMMGGGSHSNHHHDFFSQDNQHQDEILSSRNLTESINSCHQNQSINQQLLPPPPPPPPKQKKKRGYVSCRQCRKRRSACSRELPCKSCVMRGEGNQCDWRDATPQVILDRTSSSSSSSSSSMMIISPQNDPGLLERIEIQSDLKILTVKVDELIEKLQDIHRAFPIDQEDYHQDHINDPGRNGWIRDC